MKGGLKLGFSLLIMYYLIREIYHTWKCHFLLTPQKFVHAFFIKLDNLGGKWGILYCIKRSRLVNKIIWQPFCFQLFENRTFSPVFEWSASLDHFLNRKVSLFLYNKQSRLAVKKCPVRFSNGYSHSKTGQIQNRIILFSDGDCGCQT